MLVLKLYLSSTFAHLRNWWRLDRSMQEYVKIPSDLHLMLLVRVVIRCYAEISHHKICKEVKESILDSSTSANSWKNLGTIIMMGYIEKKDSSYSAALQLSDSLFNFFGFRKLFSSDQIPTKKRLLTSSSEQDTPHKEAGKAHMKVRLIHCSSCFLARNMSSKCQILTKPPQKSNN